MRKWLIILGAALAACDAPAAEAPSADVRAAAVNEIPAGPDDVAWDRVPVHVAEFRTQDMVEPRKLEAGTGKARIRAVHDGRTLAFRIRWEDPSEDRVRKPGTFADACAVQLPVSIGPDLPAPQMGEPGKPVAISYWTAAELPKDIRTLYPRAQVDHYPFAAASLEDKPQERERMEKRYAPAHALGNTAGRPVQDLVAQGPGTLRPATDQVSRAAATRGDRKWTVMLSRPVPESLVTAGRSHVSFALWDGAAEDAGSRKMWTPWIVLRLEVRP